MAVRAGDHTPACDHYPVIFTLLILKFACSRTGLAYLRGGILRLDGTGEYAGYGAAPPAVPGGSKN